MGWAHQPAGGDREIVAPGTRTGIAGHCVKIRLTGGHSLAGHHPPNINQTVFSGKAESPTHP